MNTYTYSAKDTASGELIKAEVRADSTQAAANLLTGRNLFPITIDEKKPGDLLERFGLKRISTKERTIFTRQLATLINAGLPLTRALRTVEKQVPSREFRSIIENVVASVEGGSSLAAAFNQNPKTFSEVYVSLVAAGETSGTLDETLLRVADQQEKDASIAKKVRGAMIYPILVLVVIIAVIIFMLITVLPQVGALYVSLNKQLPIFTRILLGLSNLILHLWWLVIIALGGLVYAIRTFGITERGQMLIDRSKLNLPLIGPLFKKVYMERYCRTMGSLFASGIPILDGLQIVKGALHNQILAADIDASIIQVKAGKSLSSTLQDHPRFLDLVPQMVSIGEESGAMDEMLKRAADFYQEEVDEQVNNLSTTLEPVMMIILAAIIGFLILAVLFPIYSLVGTGIN